VKISYDRHNSKGCLRVAGVALHTLTHFERYWTSYGHNAETTRRRASWENGRFQRSRGLSVCGWGCITNESTCKPARIIHPPPLQFDIYFRVWSDRNYYRISPPPKKKNHPLTQLIIILHFSPKYGRAHCSLLHSPYPSSATTTAL